MASTLLSTVVKVHMNNFNSSTAFTHPVLGATQISQYRGIEHPFGHIWKWAEGINVRALPLEIEMYTANGYTFSSINYITIIHFRVILQ
jgi:hypothetical protein